MVHRLHAAWCYTRLLAPTTPQIATSPPHQNFPQRYDGCDFVVCVASLVWVSWYVPSPRWCVPGWVWLGVCAWGWGG